MSVIPINVAVEDFLSEAVARKLLRASGRDYAVGAVFGRGGFGYLKKLAPGWNRAASGTPFFLLTDLDTRPCPGGLITDWFGGRPHANMLARVAVREVEAWLLADIESLALFLSVSEDRVHNEVESLPDPKSTLLHLVARSPDRALRARILPKPDSTAKQGPDYNACLAEFVNSKWNIQAACLNAPSLKRSFQRCRDFTPSWPS